MLLAEFSYYMCVFEREKIWDVAQIWGKGDAGRERDRDTASTAIKAPIVQLDSGRSCLNLVHQQLMGIGKRRDVGNKTVMQGKRIWDLVTNHHP